MLLKHFVFSTKSSRAHYVYGGTALLFLGGPTCLSFWHSQCNQHSGVTFRIYLLQSNLCFFTRKGRGRGGMTQWMMYWIGWLGDMGSSPSTDGLPVQSTVQIIALPCVSILCISLPHRSAGKTTSITECEVFCLFTFRNKFTWKKRSLHRKFW